MDPQFRRCYQVTTEEYEHSLLQIDKLENVTKSLKAEINKLQSQKRQAEHTVSATMLIA